MQRKPTLRFDLAGTFCLGNSLFGSEEDTVFSPGLHNRTGEPGLSGRRRGRHVADRPGETN
jgi:hypothetical protein